jgi:enoyl-CoA hydratase
MTSDLVTLDWHGDVAVLAMNRPAKRNAFNAQMNAEFGAQLEACRDAGCVVLTGADPSFCSGADLRAEPDEIRDSGYPIAWEQLRHSSVPVIAAVNGAAITGGLALVVAADFAIASERATFCDNELLVIGFGNAQLMAPLQQRVGPAWARELSLATTVINADTALRIGLVNHVVRHEDLLPRALDLAAKVAEKDRAAVAAMRREWDAIAGLPLETARQLHDNFYEPFRNAQTAFNDESRVRSLMERPRQ